LADDDPPNRPVDQTPYRFFSNGLTRKERCQSSVRDAENVRQILSDMDVAFSQVWQDPSGLPRVYSICFRPVDFGGCRF